jgi:hypothetical protein
MTSSARLMAAGMPAQQAVQIAGDANYGLIGTGGTKAAAVQLIAGTNFITTCASAGVAAFQLPPAEQSPVIAVYNGGASPALVFAAGTVETINALTAGASFSVTNGKSCIFTSSKKNTNTPSTPVWIASLSA